MKHLYFSLYLQGDKQSISSDLLCVRRITNTVYGCYGGDNLLLVSMVESRVCLLYMYFQLILFSYILAFAFDVTEEKNEAFLMAMERIMCVPVQHLFLIS